MKKILYGIENPKGELTSIPLSTVPRGARLQAERWTLKNWKRLFREGYRVVEYSVTLRRTNRRVNA